VSGNVPVAEATRDEVVLSGRVRATLLSERVQEALGELVGQRRRGCWR
jgi:hypothetical protein